MKNSLPYLLEVKLGKMRPAIEESGLVVEVFDSLKGLEKNSFGVYVGNGDKGFYLTVWGSGEMQVSTIDYNSDSEPREKYSRDVAASQIESEIQRLMEWVCGTKGAGEG
ncbi:hypothetical protein [Amycolatopsis pittospori]|uniref:hypothetical protein n=1 Tax=Amycolatopsis pittospori TaxID=2749434 RepID=UPI0015F1140D|nr:hypothetical protein [Amycolatopsis pittospori]